MLTDKDNVLSLTKQSIESNQLVNVDVKPLVWGEEDKALELAAQGFPDVVIFSDCITWPNLYKDLIKTLEIVCGPKTKLIFANERRSMELEVEFYAQLSRSFHFSNVDPKLQDPVFQSEDIYLFTARKKVIDQGIKNN